MATKEEWFAIVEVEEGEQLVSTLLDEILQKAQEVIFERHIESQVLPYAVQFAKETLLNLIDWNFFKHDHGTIDPNTWTPDKEHEPIIIDSWARGAIPTKKPPQIITNNLNKKQNLIENSSFNLLNDNTNIENSKDFDSNNSIKSQKNPVAKLENSALLSVKIQNTSKTGEARGSSSSNFSIKPGNSSSMTAIKRRSYKRSPINKPIDTVESSQTPVTVFEQSIQEENKRTLNRIKNVEKDGAKTDFGYDIDGRIIAIKKISHQNTMNQKIKIKILKEEDNPEVESKGTLTKNRFNANRHSAEKKVVDENVKKISNSKSKHNNNNLKLKSSLTNLNNNFNFNNLGEEKIYEFIQDSSLDITPLVETMRLAPGVTLKEGEITKKGHAFQRKVKDIPINLKPTINSQLTNFKLLKPISSNLKNSELHLNKVLGKVKNSLKLINVGEHIDADLQRNQTSKILPDIKEQRTTGQVVP
ncbi:hypothetical protein HK099_004798 [Clydaea vesicula]|uniref:Uncharacterized protein n=1 Tax=Clydaea vesicula TaxID=447962 RepID=A0AAD5U6W2_9FUNG|nr:hypothetical protein HK099_004798 [Clydaea vesicula]